MAPAQSSAPVPSGVPGLAACIPAFSSSASRGTMTLSQQRLRPQLWHLGIRDSLRKGWQPPPATLHFCDQNKDFVIGERHLDETSTILFTGDLSEQGTRTAGAPQHPRSHLCPYLARLWHDGAAVVLPFENCHIPDVGCNLSISCTGGPRARRGGSYTSPPPLLGAAIPPHHLINTASPYTLEKKPLKRCNVGEGLRRGVQQHTMLQGSNIHMNKPAWASLLQGRSDVAELKQIVERTRTISGCSKCHCGSITSASCDTPSPHPSSSEQVKTSREGDGRREELRKRQEGKYILIPPAEERKKRVQAK